MISDYIAERILKLNILGETVLGTLNSISKRKTTIAKLNKRRTSELRVCDEISGKPNLRRSSIVKRSNARLIILAVTS